MPATGAHRFGTPNAHAAHGVGGAGLHGLDVDIVTAREAGFVTVEHDIHVEGALALAEKQTIVYREMPTGPSGSSGPPAPQDVEFGESRQLDSTALFRYSALTFNGHRIHYDADYDTIAEITGQPVRWAAPRGSL